MKKWLRELMLQFYRNTQAHPPCQSVERSSTGEKFLL